MNVKELRLPEVESEQSFYWVLFDSPLKIVQVANVEYKLFCSFEWDCYDENIINDAIKNCVYRKLSEHWQDDAEEIEEYSEAWHKYHVDIIAIMVKHFELGLSTTPAICCLDDDDRNNEICVSNGNHRVRALQFAGYDAFPVRFIYDKEDSFWKQCLSTQNILKSIFKIAEQKGFLIQSN